jgi:hypothetical protein
MPFDDAFDFLVDRLAALPRKTADARIRQSYGCDLWLPDVVLLYWQPRIGIASYSDLQPEHFPPLYDAAWELCRIGVLRPGGFAPRGQASGGQLYSGDGFAVTEFGRTWLTDASQRPILDPGRVAAVLGEFGARFGSGFAQRATEAVRTYRTCNYLAACVLCGAAAESILLALAITKTGDETAVLQEYKSASGRGRVTKRVCQGLAQPLVAQMEALLQVLHYWRDDAGHGTATTISEIQAHFSLSQLLRLAQFASVHWSKLTA